jgi:hypothetical protein
VNDSAADVLTEPILVGRAIGTTVVKADLQRKERTAEQEEESHAVG